MAFYYSGYIWDEVGLKGPLERRYYHLWSDLRACLSRYDSSGGIYSYLVFESGKEVLVQSSVPRKRNLNYRHARKLNWAVDSAGSKVQLDEFSREIMAWEQLRDIYAEALKHNDAMIPPSLELARAHRCRGSMKVACQIMDQLLEENACNATLWEERGWTALLAGMGYKKVVPFYERAVELEPDNIACLSILFHQCLLHAKYDRADIWLHRILSTKKEGVLGVQCQAMLFYARKDLQGAITVLEDAVALDWPDEEHSVLQDQLDDYLNLRDHAGARFKLLLRTKGIPVLIFLFYGWLILQFVFRLFLMAYWAVCGGQSE